MGGYYFVGCDGSVWCRNGHSSLVGDDRFRTSSRDSVDFSGSFLHFFGRLGCARLVGCTVENNLGITLCVTLVSINVS